MLTISNYFYVGLKIEKFVTIPPFLPRARPGKTKFSNCVDITNHLCGPCFLAMFIGPNYRAIWPNNFTQRLQHCYTVQYYASVQLATGRGPAEGGSLSYNSPTTDTTASRFNHPSCLSKGLFVACQILPSVPGLTSDRQLSFGRQTHWGKGQENLFYIYRRYGLSTL